MKDFVFVSGNQNKVILLEKFLGQKVEHHKLALAEIQSLDSEEVVHHKVKEAYKILKRPVLIDDAALSFNVMGKLPGPLIKYFLQEIGNDGICQLLDAYSDRSAIASVTYGYYDGQEIRTFSESVRGQISDKPRGINGHGFDPIFIPEGQTKTHAEMTDDEYKIHVRYRAVQKLATFVL